MAEIKYGDFISNTGKEADKWDHLHTAVGALLPHN